MSVYGLLQSAGIDFIPWQTNFSYRAASTLGNPNFLAGHMVHRATCRMRDDIYAERQKQDIYGCRGRFCSFRR